MLVHALRELGFPDAARTAQHCGKGGTADLNEAAIPGYHVECKNVASIAAIKYHDQAVRDSTDGRVPLVCMKGNRTGWYAMLSLADFARLYHEAQSNRCQNQALG